MSLPLFRSLGKKLSGLLHTGDENDWSDLGLDSIGEGGTGTGIGNNGDLHNGTNGGTTHHFSRDF